MAKLETQAEYQLASQQQLRDAAELLQPPSLDPGGADAMTRHLVGAMYLAGYAVECGLKEFLLRRFGPLVTPAPGTGVTFDQIQPHVDAALGKKLKDLHSLTDLWNATGLSMRSTTMTANLGACAIWRVDWRYRPPANRARVDAEQLVNAASDLVTWMGNQSP
ncbi:hypothetical protein LLH23_18030 [bacterium]|nr:hypothetical protein [bacterium]